MNECGIKKIQRPISVRDTVLLLLLVAFFLTLGLALFATFFLLFAAFLLLFAAFRLLSASLFFGFAGSDGGATSTGGVIAHLGSVFAYTLAVFGAGTFWQVAFFLTLGLFATGSGVFAFGFIIVAACGYTKCKGCGYKEGKD